MSPPVDLRELAIDRGGPRDTPIPVRRHLLTRYVLPLALVCGFVAVVIWASWETVFPPKPVTVMPVIATTSAIQQEGATLFQAAGWIEPRPTTVRVAALAPGVVETLLVVEDQPVKRGEAVAELVKDDARLAHDRAMADLRLREAELTEVEAVQAAAQIRLDQPVHLQAALGEAEAALARTETQLRNLPFEIRRAESELQVARTSFEGKTEAREVIAGIEVDIAKSKFESAQALLEELHARRASLDIEQAALTARRDAVQTRLDLLTDETKAKREADAMQTAAEARVAQAQIAVAEAQLRLERMTIRAPIDGRIYRLVAHPGAYVGPGAGMLAGKDGGAVVTMYDPHSLQVRVDVRFDDIPQVILNQPVEIDNPALPSPLAGRVLFISSEADIQKNTLQVKVEITSASPVLKPEMLVDITFIAPRPTDSVEADATVVKLFAPADLVRQNGDFSFVWIADQSEGTARKAPVQSGNAANNGLIEITRGLTVTSRLIVEGTDGLKEGDRIVVSGESLTTRVGRHAASHGDLE